MLVFGRMGEIQGNPRAWACGMCLANHYGMTLDPSQIVAVLMPENLNAPEAMATVMVRNADGDLSVHMLSTQSAFGRQLVQKELQRKRVPIVDPISRQVMGYETH